jgi:hypothetical protein
VPMTLRSFSRLLPVMATRGKRLRERHQAAAAKIKEYAFAKEFTTDLPRMAMLSAPSDSSPYASLRSIPASKIDDHDGRDVAHCSGTKKYWNVHPRENQCLNLGHEWQTCGKGILLFFG